MEERLWYLNCEILEGFKGLLGAMMGVSYYGERMIGNLPFSLFNELKGKKETYEGDEMK